MLEASEKQLKAIRGFIFRVIEDPVNHFIEKLRKVDDFSEGDHLSDESEAVVSHR